MLEGRLPWPPAGAPTDVYSGSWRKFGILEFQSNRGCRADRLTALVGQFVFGVVVNYKANTSISHFGKSKWSKSGGGGGGVK